MFGVATFQKTLNMYESVLITKAVIAFVSLQFPK